MTRKDFRRSSIKVFLWVCVWNIYGYWLGVHFGSMELIFVCMSGQLLVSAAVIICNYVWDKRGYD